MSFERVNGWHNALFEGGYYGAYKIKIAKFRDDEKQIVSGSPQRLQIHYEALSAERIEYEMRNF